MGSPNPSKRIRNISSNGFERKFRRDLASSSVKILVSSSVKAMVSSLIAMPQMCERISIGLIFNDEVSSSKMVSSTNVRMNRRAAPCYVIVCIVSYREITNKMFSLTQSKLYISKFLGPIK